jgi:YD repeat-containing protein
VFPLMPVLLSTLDGEAGNFVSTAAGYLAFTTTDLSTNGLMPVMFQRVYASSRQEDTGLGIGWSFVFDDRIVVSGNTAILTSGAGSTIAFRRDESSQRFILQTEQTLPYQAFEIRDSNTIVEQSMGLTRLYKKLGESYRLTRITDSNDNQISIDFDSRTNPTRIASSSGGVITLKWSQGASARLLAVRNNAGHEVRFRQTGRHLRSVVDQTNAEWAYEYLDGRLTRARDPLGRVLLRARYDRASRVIEAGDAVGVSRYEYDAAPISRRTTITDPLGATAVYEHAERGTMLNVGNNEGAVSQIEYNSHNRPVRKWELFGGETKYVYDAQNRLLHQSSSNGEEKSFTYDKHGRVAAIRNGAGRVEYERDARGNIVGAKSNQAETTYRAVVNSRGQVVSLKSQAEREISFEEDSAGNETAYNDSLRGRFQTERDALGRITAQRFPSGLSKHYEYSLQGVLMKQSDNFGRFVAFERDASGMVTGLVTNDGWVRATRDQTGRIIAVTDASGKLRRFAYDARGALTDYVDALGRHTSLKLDLL